MKTLTAVASTLALVAGGVVVTASPAEADGGRIAHYFPDEGYDPELPIHCLDFNFGILTFRLAEGQSSASREGCDVLKEVYVYSGSSIWCKYGTNGVYRWEREYGTTGWRPVNGTAHGLGCTYRLD
jgi:hypothetical protein